MGYYCCKNKRCICLHLSKIGDAGYNRVKKYFNWKDFGNKINEKLSESINNYYIISHVTRVDDK